MKSCVVDTKGICVFIHSSQLGSTMLTDSISFSNSCSAVTKSSNCIRLWEAEILSSSAILTKLFVSIEIPLSQLWVSNWDMSDHLCSLNFRQRHRKSLKSSEALSRSEWRPKGCWRAALIVQWIIQQHFQTWLHSRDFSDKRSNPPMKHSSSVNPNLKMSTLVCF